MLRLLRRQVPKRTFTQVPFENELTPADEDLFNLQDFQHYQESPQIEALRQRAHWPIKFEEFCELPETAMLSSGLRNPYLNLAIEDYVYNRMPAQKHVSSDRLLFYTNSPCVVIGKNQNPWKEVNLPALQSLRVPLLRRRSGGGTVVHDTGNVNFSYMTTKDKFDRFWFAELICRAVNSALGPEKKLLVNDRGDIVTEKGAFKVSGSAYKLSKGKSYHHGTMLLNSKLDVLRQLLHREEGALGCVQSTSAVSSVKSPVANIHLPNEEFMSLVRNEFTKIQGEKDISQLGNATPEFPHLFIDKDVQLPEEIHHTAQQLMEWDWKYGNTPKFSHVFTHPKYNFSLTLEIGKDATVQSMELMGANEETKEAFEYLDAVLDRGDQVKYTGSNVAGFILNDELSEWLGNSIDGTS